MSQHVNDWYSHFLAKRSVPIKREIPPNAPTEGFALVLGTMHLTKLTPGARYRIAAYFYDSSTSQLFGSPYHTAWNQPDHHDCDIGDEIFFHCPRLDDKIMLVLEVVEDPPSDKSNIRTIAWGFVPVGKVNSPMAEYGRTPPGFKLSTIRLYPGSPKVLTFSSQFDPDTTSLGNLEGSLFSHRRMEAAADFVPDFCLVGRDDDVPGLRHHNNLPQLADPVPLPEVPAAIDEIGLSFGPHADRIEKMLLDDVNSDRLYSENHKPGAATKPMQVLERRLRIGVHNGFAFLFEPVIVHLSSLDEQLTGTHSLRRKGRPLSRSNTDFRSEMNTLFVRSRVSLPKLADDDRMTVVFALDYLLGIRNINSNATSHTHSVIVCWGAWKPFVEKSLLDRGRIHASVSLIGGPRPNPEESLCYKNLLHLYRRDDSIFTESAPKITIQFNFMLDDMRQLDTRLSSRGDILTVEDRNRATPAPRTEFVESEKVSSRQRDDQREDTPSETPRSGRPRPQNTEPDELEDRLPPIQTQKPIMKAPSSSVGRSIDRLIEDVPEISPRENIPLRFEIPWKETRVTNASRSASAALASVKFPVVLDRHGDPPVLVDVTSGVLPDMEKEENDRLDTNEVVLQFMAIKCLTRPDAVTPKKVFFTTHFYRFPEVTTEEMLLSDSNNNAEPNILRRLDVNGKEITEQGSGFMAKFIVDRQWSRVSGRDELLRHLGHDSLAIDVWDSESLILMGNCIVPLRCLLRRGNEAVQCLIQAPIVLSSIPGETTTTGLLYLKMANVGHPSSNQIDMVHSRTSAVVSRRMKRLGEEGPGTYRILARPLNPIHEDAPQRFLHAQRLDIQQRYETQFNEDTHDRLRQWERLKTTIPLTAQKTAFKKFVFDEQLEAYRQLRNESKASKLLQAVFKGITLQHKVYPSVGERHFFEYLLQNTYPDPINCVIEIDEPGLSVVSDADEWQFYKRQNGLTTPLEKNMFHEGRQGSVEVFLKPMESIYVPFLYDDFKAAKYTDGQCVESKVLFRRWDNGDPVSILDLRIDHRPPTTNMSMRFYHEQSTQATKHIAISGIQGDRRIGAVRCNDPTVKVALRNQGVEQELQFSMFCGSAGSSRSVLVMLYGDTYAYRLLSTWRITMHALERIDVRTTQGQSTKITLNIQRHESGNELLQLHSSSSCLRPQNQQPVLATNEHIQMNMIYAPEYTGRRQHVVTVVDTSSRCLKWAWLVAAKAETAAITTRYEMRIEIGNTHLVAKKLSISNPYSIPRSFRITSSRPRLVQIAEEIIDIPANQSRPIGIFFQNTVQKPVTKEILIFVQNVETGQPEETFALQVSYVEP